MHGGVFQIKVPVHYAWWSFSNVPCTQWVESFKLKSLYTMHGGVFQIKVPVHLVESFKLKVPVHNAWWSLSN